MSEQSFFDDVSDLYHKFGFSVPRTDLSIPREMAQFRIRFMLEEVCEYAKSLGYDLRLPSGGSLDPTAAFLDEVPGEAFDRASALDALVDVVVVALGTADLHKFPYNDAWDAVHEANLLKVPGPTKRGFGWDLAKPPGWRPPNHQRFIDLQLQRLNKEVR